jgi:hypothetical protein
MWLILFTIVSAIAAIFVGAWALHVWEYVAPALLAPRSVAREK